MPGKRPKKNKSVISSFQDPFLNNKIYPISAIVSTGFLDPYLNNFYSRNPHETYIKGTRFSTIIDDINCCVNNISDRARQYTEELNFNNMKLLNELYNNDIARFKVTVKNKQKYIKTLNDKLKVVDPKSLRNGVYEEQDINAILKYQYVTTLNEAFVLPLHEYMDKFNKESYYSVYSFMDFNELVCIHKDYGIMFSNRSDLGDNDLRALGGFGPNLLNYYANMGVKTDAVWVEYIRILFAIKGEPLGAIFVDPDLSPSNPAYLDYFNGQEIRDMFENDHGDDDLDDDDDDDI